MGALTAKDAASDWLLTHAVGIASQPASLLWAIPKKDGGRWGDDEDPREYMNWIYELEDMYMCYIYIYTWNIMEYWWDIVGIAMGY